MELEVGGRSKREARSGGKRSMYGADAAGLRVLGGVGAMDGSGWWWVVVEGVGDCRDRRGADVSGWLRSQAWRRRGRIGMTSAAGSEKRGMRNVEGNESRMNPNE